MTNLTRLNKSVSLMVPATVNINQDGKEKQTVWVDRLMAEFAQMFGGVSVHAVKGGWWSEQHGLVREELESVQSMTTDDRLDQHIATVIGLAEQIKADMSQEAVSVTVNGEMFLV